MSDIVEHLRKAAWSESTVQEAADTIEAIRAENDKLRAALKPFADAADYCPVDDDEPYNKRFLSGTLRAAKKAMRNC